LRYYAPWLGRWTSADPMGNRDGSNLYRYASANPIRLKDPSGTSGWDWSDLKELAEEVGQMVEKKVKEINRQEATPTAKPMSKKEARKHANKQAKDYRKKAGMNQGAEVQAGHTAAARHAPQSGISKEDWDKQKMQELHSRKGKGLDVTVTDQAGQQKVTTRHRSQEGLIDDAVDRVKNANGGKLTPQGQLDAAEEVRWRTENVPMDQRDVDAVRNSGPAKPEKGPPVDIETGRVKTPPVAKAGQEVIEKSGRFAKAGKSLLKAGRHFVAAVPILGIVAGQASAAHAASEGDYVGAALDEAGFIPVAGDVLDAGRGGMAVGEAATALLPSIEEKAMETGEAFESAAKWVGFGEDTSRVIGAGGAAVGAIGEFASYTNPITGPYKLVSSFFD
jgi:hypothetical protein